MHAVKIAETESEIRECYPVISQLRPHLDIDEFLVRIDRQRKTGYKLAYIMEQGKISSVAGFRIAHNLAWGKHLYIDDLITLENDRSKGFGKSLIQWLKDEARRTDCREVHLDTGIQRKDAHRFYEREGMTMTCFHYVLKVK